MTDTITCGDCGKELAVEAHECTRDPAKRTITERLKRWNEIHANIERERFIRDAAVRIYVQGMTVPDKAPGVVTFQPRTCWLAARELWDGKPEDC